MSHAREPTELETALIAGLAVQANQLTQAATDLRETYRFSRALKVIVVLGFLMMAGLIVIALQNRATGNAVRTNTGVIKDCTTPRGHCYQQSRDATGEAVAQIVAGVNTHTDLVLIATLECSHRPMSDLAFEKCLHRKGLRSAHDPG